MCGFTPVPSQGYQFDLRGEIAILGICRRRLHDELRIVRSVVFDREKGASDPGRLVHDHDRVAALEGDAVERFAGDARLRVPEGDPGLLPVGLLGFLAELLR